MGFGKDGKGAIVIEQRSQALGALGALTGVIVGTKLPLIDDYRYLKGEIMAGIVDLTSGQGQNLILGLADGNMTLAEIEEAMETNGPVSKQDPVAANTAERPVFVIGALGSTGTFYARMLDAKTGNPMIEAKPRWTFGATSFWNYFVYNQADAAITTGATFLLQSKVFGVWVG